MAAQQRTIDAEVARKGRWRSVEVTVKGSGEVVAVKIDPKVVDPGTSRRCRIDSRRAADAFQEVSDGAGEWSAAGGMAARWVLRDRSQGL